MGSFLSVAIDRWLRSYVDMLLVDRFMDLGIGLESLYLDGIRDELMDVERSNLEAKTDPTATQTQMLH